MSEHSELVAEIAMVEKMSTQERLKHAKKRRIQQLKKWGHYDKHLDKENNKRKKQGNNKKTKKKKVSKVHFTNNVMLLEAAARNDLEEVRNLLTQGVTPDVTNEDGLTALHQCCIDDSEEMMKLLIEFGANVNARDSELWTPLHAAATCGHNHLCKYLIEKGAELLAVNADGNMPYDICEDELTLDYIETEMAKRGVTQELIDETRLSTEKNMLEDLKFLGANGGDLEFVDRNGATPLHTAAANGYVQVAEFLLDQHVSVEIQDDDSWMPIHAAACWGHPAVLELLVHNGADIESKTKNGETPFDICEDLELKQRIIELKDEIETNKATRVVELRQRRNQNPRSSAICNSASSLYSSNTSLTDKNPFSASVRRTSMREKSAMSWKEAREEARLRGSTASEEGEDEFQPSAVQNGDNKENLPTSNIDDVKLAMTELEQKKDTPVPQPEPHAELNDNYVDSQEHDIGKMENADGSNSNISVANDKRTAPTRAKNSQPNEPAPITSPKQASNAHAVAPSKDRAIPSGTLADLKKQRALQLQSRLHSALPNHNSNNVQDSDQNKDMNNAVNDNRNGHSKKMQNNGNNGTHIPGDPPLHRFTAAPASEIIGGDESKHRCCIIM